MGLGQNTLKRQVPKKVTRARSYTGHELNELARIKNNFFFL